MNERLPIAVGEEMRVQARVPAEQAAGVPADLAGVRDRQRPAHSRNTVLA